MAKLYLLWFSLSANSLLIAQLRGAKPPLNAKGCNMNANIQTLFFNELPVRHLVKDDGTIWFIASDISKQLEYAKTSNLIDMLDDDEKADTVISGIRSANGVEQSRQFSIISESGFYHAVIKSRKKGATIFRKWVTSVVLPTIRETGGFNAESTYITPNERTKIMRLAASKALSIMHANDLPFKKDVNAGRFTFTTDTNTKSCLVSEIRAAICGHYSITGYLRLKTQDKKDVHAIIDEFVPLFIYYDDKKLIGYSDFMNSQLRMLQMGMFTHPSIKIQPSLFDDGVGQSYPIVESHKVLQVPPPPTQSPVDLEALVKQINEAEKAVKALMANAQLQNA